MSTSFHRILACLMAALVAFPTGASAFCGFYVAKADATLFNNKSEVILVRDGLRTVITMSNDFKGDVRDFAMVVPVPVVLKESDIKVIDRRIFATLDAYSAPRLVEYYDSNPCYVPMVETCNAALAPQSFQESFSMIEEKAEADLFGVTIEAEYTVGEYDILILSATESAGLKDWLLLNGYKIPATADEVLQPYIRSNTKFFVVKVNLERMAASGFDYLSPLQIAFEHEKFMLPIRLGMANSTGVQDMIVYAFTRSGRVECTNYRTVKMPTDRNIPLFVQERFGEFYKDLFLKHWRNEGRNAVMLEYAWNVTPSWGGMKCDPCVGPPPIYNDFAQAGVWWANDWNNPGSVFFTRLHVRYGRDKFPSDLTFQVTPNTENYQARYVLTHPAQGPFDCEEGQAYLETLRDRRRVELQELYALTGVQDPRGGQYLREFDRYLDVKPAKPEGQGTGGNSKKGSTGQPPQQPENYDEERNDIPPYLPALDSPGGPDNRRWLVGGFFLVFSLMILWVARRPEKVVRSA